MKGLYPESVSPHHVRLAFLLSLGLNAVSQKKKNMEALRGKKQTQGLSKSRSEAQLSSTSEFEMKKQKEV